MADNERKKLIWTVKKGLFRLSAEELLQITSAVPRTSDQDPAKLNKHDEEGCIDYVCSYMESAVLLELEDEGISQLLFLKDMIGEIIHSRKQAEFPAEGEEDGTVSDANVSPSLPSDVVHISTHVTGTHTETTTTDSASQHVALESQLNKLLSSYDELCQKLKLDNASRTPHIANTQPTDNDCNQSYSSHVMQLPCSNADQHSTNTTESMIALKDLPLLQRKEYKIHGGQIGDNTSEISYSNISKQIDQGLKEKHTEDEITRAVFRIIKPGNFKDMLASKDEMTIVELKSFLQSHLGEKSSTELFQELMNAKQHEHETPQQFLYRVMGLKQKVIFTSRQTDSDIKYEARTAQNVFLRTVYQGLSEKHDDIRRELRTLLSDPTVTDEALLRQVTKTTSEESERKRRLGRSTRPKLAHAQSSEVNTSEVNKGKCNADTNAKDELIHQLSAQVQALTQAVSSLQSNVTAAAKPPTSEPQPQCTCQCSNKQSRQLRKERPYGCPNCITSGRTNCNHCFACGEEGHRAVGCLKRPKPQGNAYRSWQRDNP